MTGTIKQNQRQQPERDQGANEQQKHQDKAAQKPDESKDPKRTEKPDPSAPDIGGTGHKLKP